MTTGHAYEPQNPLERVLVTVCGFDLVRHRYVRCRGRWSLIQDNGEAVIAWGFGWADRRRGPTLLEAMTLVAGGGEEATLLFRRASA